MSKLAILYGLTFTIIPFIFICLIIYKEYKRTKSLIYYYEVIGCDVDNIKQSFEKCKSALENIIKTIKEEQEKTNYEHLY